jgi:hypothetical protein
MRYFGLHALCDDPVVIITIIGDKVGSMDACSLS